MMGPPSKASKLWMIPQGNDLFDVCLEALWLIRLETPMPSSVSAGAVDRKVLSVLLFCAAGLALSCGKVPGNHVEGSASNAVASVTNSVSAADKAQIVSSTNVGQAEFDIDKSTEHLTRGNALLAAGNDREAVEHFALAVKFNPEDEDLYYNLALAQARTGDAAAAKKNYEKALEIYPDYIEAHINLGNLLVNEGKFEEAIEHFSKAIEQSPGNASAHNNLGNAYARQKKFAQSLAQFQTALRLNADYPEAQFNLGNAYLLLGRFDEAIEEFNRLLQLHPDFSRARAQLAKAQAAKQKQGSNNKPTP